MTDLIPLTALGAKVPAQFCAGALTLIENSDLALASVSLRQSAPAPTPFGLTLPEPGACTHSQGIAAFWTSPGQWMLAAENRAGQDFAAQVAAAAPGCSVTEQTDGWTAFEVHGPAAAIRALMEKLVNIDAHGFRPGAATRTALHHISVFLIRRADDHLTIIGMRSYAAALFHTLSETLQRQNAT